MPIQSNSRKPIEVVELLHMPKTLMRMTSRCNITNGQRVILSPNQSINRKCKARLGIDLLKERSVV